MKKKQIIGLGTLLLVLLLGSFTTSYAMSVSQAEECMQYITDQYNANYTPYYKVCVPALINSNLWAQHKNEIGFDTYNTIIMRCLYESAIVYVDFVTLNTDNTYINNAFIQFNTNNATISNVRICRFKMSRTGVVSSFEFTTKDLYYNTLNRNPTDQSVWCAAVIQANNIVNTTDYFYFGKGFSVAVPFMFVPKASDVYADVWTYEDVPLYNASGDDLYIGQLFHPLDVNIDTNIFSNFYWQFGTWNLRQLPINCIYLRYVDTQNDVVFYDVYLKSQYINANTLYEFVWQDRREEPYNTAYGMFYIKNNYTVITNGALDPNSTFSGDYKDKYDNDLQNEQDINNISEAINDTINQPVDVSGELAGIFSGDLYNIAEGFGFDSTQGVYFTFIENFLRNVCNVLLDDNDAYFDYSLHGEDPYRIYASDVGLPSNHPLRIFLSIILTFLTIYLLYFQFMKVFELLQTSAISDAIKSQDVNFYMFRM